MLRLLTVLALALSLNLIGAGDVSAKNAEACYNSCIKAFGTDARHQKNCAMSCDYHGDPAGTNPSNGKPTTADQCRTDYQYCMGTCGANTACKNNCERNWKSCF